MIGHSTIHVAVDHSDRTLDRYLSDLQGVRRTNEVIRRHLATAALKAGADGMVIAGDDMEWALASFPNCNLFLGLPDTNKLKSLVHIAADLLERMPSLDQFPLKVGLHVSRPEASSSSHDLREQIRL